MSTGHKTYTQIYHERDSRLIFTRVYEDLSDVLVRKVSLECKLDICNLI